MKTKNYFLAAMIGLAVIGITVSSCKKKTEEEETDSDTAACSDNAYAEGSYNDAANMADEAGLSGSVSNYKMQPGEESGLLACATVSFDTLGGNKKLTIDFGTGCAGLDGKTRKGKVMVSWDKPKFKDSLCTRTITFDNYYVNDNKIEGTKAVQYKGHVNGKMTWQITVTGAKIILASNGGTISWDRSGTRTLLAGENTNGTINWGGSKWEITGSGSGTSAAGKSYTYSIGTALVKDFLCSASKRHFIAGTFTLTPSGKLARTIDYGSGACDDDATVSIAGKSYPIKLK